MIPLPITDLFLTLLFALDIILWGFFEQKIISLVLCLSSILIFRTTSTFTITYLLFLLSLEGLFDFYCYGIPLLYLLPLTFLIRNTRNILQPHTMLPFYATLLVCLLCNTLLRGYYSPHNLYSFYSISAHVLFVFLFSQLFFKTNNKFVIM